MSVLTASLFFCLFLSYTRLNLPMSTPPTSHPLVKLPHSRFSDKKLERGKCVLSLRSSSFFGFPSVLSSLSLSLSQLLITWLLFSFAVNNHFALKDPLKLKFTLTVVITTQRWCLYGDCSRSTKVTVKFDFRSWVFSCRSTVTLTLSLAKTKIINNLVQSSGLQLWPRNSEMNCSSTIKAFFCIHFTT